MSATMKGRTPVTVPGDARTRNHPIAKASHEVETPGGGYVSTDDGTGALEVRLPSWLTDDERRAIVEQLNAFFVAAVEAVRR